MRNDKKVFDQLVKDIPKPSCEAHLLAPGIKPCTRESSCMLVWHDKCAGGGTLAGAKTTSLCPGHRKALMNQFRSGNMICTGCHNTITSGAHGISSIEDL
jgi:hypothetical protein